MLEYC